MKTVALSPAALAVLRFRAKQWPMKRKNADAYRELVDAGIEVISENRPAFRELATARIVILGHSFVGGDESIYSFTYWGHKLGRSFLEA